MQARERCQRQAAAKHRSALAAGRPPLSRDDAVVIIQAGMRGALARRRIKAEAEAEAAFLGMRPKVCLFGCVPKIVCMLSFLP